MSKISQFLIINQNKIEILQKGQIGTPIIIFSGMGSSFDEWYEVTESLSKTNRVIMFHRPGLGASEIHNEIRNIQAVVNEISEMIHLLKLSEPVVLIGHSYGGLCVQHFVKEHPEKVAGIVLVDSTSVDLKVLDDLNLPVLNEESTDEFWMEKCRSYSQMKREELYEVINPALTKNQKLLPNDIQERLINFQLNPSLLPSWNINKEKAIIEAPNNNIVNFFKVFIELFKSGIIIKKMPINNTKKYQNPIKSTSSSINLFNSILITNYAIKKFSNIR